MKRVRFGKLSPSEAGKRAYAVLGYEGMSRIGTLGGAASQAALTPEQRREKARKAAKTRWDEVRQERDSAEGAAA